MALIYCPECGHEISQAAVACPNCGRPIQPAAPIVEPPPIIVEKREGGFPPWAIIPIVIAGLAAIFLLFMVFSRDDEDDNRNVRVNMSAQRGSSRSENVPATSSAPQPPADIGSSQNVTIPGSEGAVPAPTTGTVVIDARIATRSGQPQAVKNERFYLLDSDLETILSDAGLEGIEGESLSNSYGLAVMFPDRYGDFRDRALKAIKPHIKYAGQTDTTGRAQLGGVAPNSYYLFAITKTGRGYAIWSSPVTVITGENKLNLSPAPLTEVQPSAG